MNYNEFLEFCEKRVSYRQFSKKKVPEELIQKIFKIGQLAPSSCNQQAYKFIVINKEKELRELAEITSKKLYNTPQAMFCFTNLKVTKGNYDNIQSTAASIMSMLYAAHALGIGAYWVAGFNFNKKTKKFFEKNYNLPKGYVLQALLLFGYRDSETKEYSGKCRLPLEKNFLINESVQEEEESDKTYLNKIMPVYFDRYYRVYDNRLNEKIRILTKEGKSALYLNAFYGTYLNLDIKREVWVTNLSSFANDFLKNRHPSLKYFSAHPEKLRLKKNFDQVFLLETPNHFNLKETLRTALKHVKEGSELIIVYKNFISTKSLLYYIYKYLRKNHYNQPLEYVRNPTHFLEKRKVLATLKQLEKEENIKLSINYNEKVPSDKPILSQKFEDLVPSYTLMKVSVSKEKKVQGKKERHDR